MAFSGFIFSHALIKLSSLSMNTYIYNIYTDHQINAHILNVNRHTSSFRTLKKEGHVMKCLMHSLFSYPIPFNSKNNAKGE